MDDSKLNKAVFDQNIDEVRRILKSGNCSLDDLDRDPPIIVCVSEEAGPHRKDDAKRCRILKLLVRNGADVNAQTRVSRLDKSTAAMLAAERGYLKCLQFLVESGADLSSTSPGGDTTLTFAVRRGHADCVKYLTKHMSATALNHVTDDGETALMLAAACREDTQCLQHLIEGGADLNIKDSDGNTALMLALINKSAKSIALLLEKGADVNTMSSKGDTPLMLALTRRYTEVVTPLLQHGADSNTVLPYGQTPLLFSLRKRYNRAIKLLLENGASANKVSRNGETPLMFAIENNRASWVTLLLENGADVNSVSQNGETPLIAALRRKYSKVVSLLLERGADINAVSCNWETPIFLALENHLIEAVELLLEKGVDINAVSNNGETPFMVALKNGHAEAVTLMLNSGADINAASNSGGTPFMLALKFNHKEAVAFMIRKGVNINTLSQNGETPLMLALKFGHTEAVRFLLEKGADVNSVSNNGLTPLACARSNHILDLLRHGLNPTISRKDRGFLHNKVCEGRRPVVRNLILNGFPLLDLNETIWPIGETLPTSPLAMSLYCNRPDIAKYIVINNFFTRYDIVSLCWDPEVRPSLHHDGQARECLEILDFLSARPQSLQNLCLVNICSALNQDFVRDVPCTVQDKDRWICKPTFRERVQSLEIPSSLKEELLHQTPTAYICCHSWNDIALGKRVRFEACHCGYCEGENGGC
ncbi:ankyrin [Elysia marginata]|uniref:Ankyrin n=1 Tax=Elysia marginata TaxID=1093978 RepID=A0AAV4HZN3_9GAST|nr:ankyrin [Elysia marginata]